MDDEKIGIIGFVREVQNTALRLQRGEITEEKVRILFRIHKLQLKAANVALNHLEKEAFAAR
jgi:hypothetical protein